MMDNRRGGLDSPPLPLNVFLADEKNPSPTAKADFILESLTARLKAGPFPESLIRKFKPHPFAIANGSDASQYQMGKFMGTRLRSLYNKLRSIMRIAHARVH
jgi:hypothetical protein